MNQIHKMGLTITYKQLNSLWDQNFGVPVSVLLRERAIRVVRDQYHFLKMYNHAQYQEKYCIVF